MYEETQARPIANKLSGGVALERKKEKKEETKGKREKKSILLSNGLEHLRNFGIKWRKIHDPDAHDS